MAFRFRTIGVWRPAVMIFVCFLWLGALMSRAAAVTNYVAQAGQTPLTNYLTWATAASNIQDAINVAVASNTVLVSNGTYNLTNQISITTAITLKSVNGTNFTFINGNNFAGKSVTNRCVSMTAAGSVLDGFTITNGVLVAPATATGGGGVYINPGAVYNCYILWNTVYATNTYSGGGGLYAYTGGPVTNCTIVSNTVSGSAANTHSQSGGGIYVKVNVIGCNISRNTADGRGGGIFADNNGEVTFPIATISNCTVMDNYAGTSGGGLRFESGYYAYNCEIRRNNSGGSYGGGASIAGGCLLQNCWVTDNALTNGNYGGGIDAGSGSYITNCIITNNTSTAATAYHGSGVYIGNTTIMSDCLILGNSGVGFTVASGAILGSGANSNSVVKNCTIVSNKQYGVVLQGGGGGWFKNCVIWSNSTGTCWSNAIVAGIGGFSNCCLQATNFAAGFGNVANTTSNPLFVASGSGNYRLSAGSPCINTGANEDWMNGATDLDGHRRLDKFSGIVDMGCYEYIPKGVIFSVH